MRQSSRRNPKYLEAKARLIKLLQDGSYTPGDRLPSITALTQEFGMGQSPIFQAIRLLAEQGVLETRPGSGCYVREIPSHAPPQQPVRTESSRFLKAVSGLQTAKKRLRLAVIGDIPLFASTWARIAEGFTAEHPDVAIEIVEAKAWELVEHGISAAGDIVQVLLRHLPHFIARDQVFDPQLAGGLHVDADRLYPGALHGAEHQGRLWGVPVTCSIECVYYNGSAPELIEPFRRPFGLFEFLQALADHKDHPQAKAFESLLVNNKSFFSLLLSALTPSQSTWEAMKRFDSPLMTGVLKKLEAFYARPWIQHHGLKGDGDRTWYRFEGGKSLLASGTSTWTVKFCESLTFPWGILSHPRESQGGIGGGCNVNVISTMTPYPLECIAFLEYLAREDVQRLLAEAGQLVAHRQANQHYQCRGLEAESSDRLVADMEHIRFVATEDTTATEYITTVVHNELRRWNEGELSTEAFIESVSERTFFYDRAQRLRAKQDSRVHAAAHSGSASGP